LSDHEVGSGPLQARSAFSPVTMHIEKSEMASNIHFIIYSFMAPNY